MLPDPVSNPGPLTYESDALPIALRGPAGGNQATGSKDISILVKFHLSMSSCDLENEVRVTKI